MSMRKDALEIERGIIHGFTEDAWGDLVDDFNYSGDHDEDNLLLIQCARFIGEKFPGATYGWQDFDELISNHLGGRYPSRLHLGGTILAEDVADTEDPEVSVVPSVRITSARAEAMTDEQVAAYGSASQRGFHVRDADDEVGGVIFFHGIFTVENIRR